MGQGSVVHPHEIASKPTKCTALPLLCKCYSHCFDWATPPSPWDRGLVLNYCRSAPSPSHSPEGWDSPPMCTMDLAGIAHTTHCPVIACLVEFFPWVWAPSRQELYPLQQPMDLLVPKEQPDHYRCLSWIVDSLDGRKKGRIADQNRAMVLQKPEARGAWREEKGKCNQSPCSVSTDLCDSKQVISSVRTPTSWIKIKRLDSEGPSSLFLIYCSHVFLFQDHPCSISIPTLKCL